MKTSLKILLAAGMLCGAGMVGTIPAMAQPTGFSFRLGDIGIAYDDGYYDRSNRFHAWRHQRERDWYRSNHKQSYRSYRHDRDRDGIPNRVDRDRDNDGVRNARDRDRDNDGIPNSRDRRPNNPNR